MKKLIYKGARKIAKVLGYNLKKINADDISLYYQLYGEESVKKRRFYNISAGAYRGFGGGIHHPCWTNIDLDRSWKKTPYSPKDVEYNPKYDLAHDLLSLQPLPVETSVAEVVHTRFTIASLTDQAAEYMFNEVFRLLKKGGIFRISTPNIDLDYNAYLRNDMSFFYWFGDDRHVSIEQAFLFHVASQISTLHPDSTQQKISDEQFRGLIRTKPMEEALDFCTSKCSIELHKKYRQDHINWWNRKKLERMLRRAGFTWFYVSMREQSAAPVLRNEVYFDNDDNKFVMYMEAVKK
jgi:predicted SAM-dependent methyltransferase